MRPTNKGNGASRAKKRARAKGKDGPRRRRSTLAGVVAFLLFAGAVYAALIAGQPPLGVHLGDAAPRTFRTRTRFTRLDMDGTNAGREAARAAEPAVFRSQPDQWQASVSDVTNCLRAGEGSIAWRLLPDDVDRQAFLDLVPRLRRNTAAIRQALDDLGSGYVAANTDLQKPVMQKKETDRVVVRRPGEEESEVSLDELVALDGQGAAFRAAFGPALDGLEPGEAALARRCLAHMLKPNVSLDHTQTSDRADQAAESQPEVLEVVEEGRIILAEGSEVRPQHIEDLRRERAQFWAGPGGLVVRTQRLLGVAVLLLLVLGGAALYARRYRQELLAIGPQLLAFVLVTVALVVTARLCVIRGVSAACVPVPLAVMVMCLVHGRRFGLATAVLFSLIVRLASPGADFEFFILLVGGAMTALLTGSVRTRSALIRVGVLAGVIQFAAVWGFGLMSALDREPVPLRFWESELLTTSLAALANGVLCGFLATGLLPAIERAFRVTTDIRLLEWSDPNQPLLQRLLLDAPGSYHHSMLVGSLAAEAAEAVEANPLLARVSSYFHDVGKLKKPEYFAENLPPEGKNPHDELSPTMSSLIITAHPRDGAEMADQYGVPTVVRDIILQSHGSALLKFFWDKARRAADDGGAPERSFRYRLPKPQSKEAAVVMLCDACESAARSMGSPSVDQLRTLVHDIIYDRLHDGQLEESGLSLTDLKRLEDCLVPGLSAVFHSRVSYPDQQPSDAAVLDREPKGGPVPAAADNESDSDEAGDGEPAERP